MPVKRRASFSPAYVKNHIFWIKIKWPCGIECQRETFGDYYRSKRQTMPRAVSIFETNGDQDEIPESQYGVAMDFVFKVFPGSDTQPATEPGSVPGDETDTKASDTATGAVLSQPTPAVRAPEPAPASFPNRANAEKGVRFLFHFTLKKYFTFVLFLAIMASCWFALLSNMAYRKFVTEIPDEPYVVSHNKIRREIQEKFNVTNMLRMVTDSVLERELKDKLNCSNYNDSRHDANLFLSRKTMKWTEVINAWADRRDPADLPFRRLVWYTAKSVGCAQIQCFEANEPLRVYKCLYLYLPENYANRTLQPYETGKLNAKCRNQFDHDTNLCFNSCDFHDQSELCVRNRGYCDDFKGYSDACAGSCQCAPNKIFYAPNELEDYVGVLNEFRKYYFILSNAPKEEPELVRSKRLEKKAADVVKQCEDLDAYWHYRSNKMIRFRDLEKQVKENFRKFLTGREVVGLKQVAPLLAPGNHQVGCSFYYCSDYVILCVFESEQ